MPELPEVETIKTILEGVTKGKTIERIEIFREKNIVTDVKEFVDRLTGQTFTHMSREGKFLLFHLTNDLVMLSHLRMEGKWFEGKVGDKFAKHDLVCFDFTDGTRLVYNDTRKFGILGLWSEDTYKKESPLKDLGKEPFVLSPEELYAGLHRKKKEPIKEALLDQTLIAGLGNIYDDEVLFATKIHPLTPASEITLEQSKAIIEESIKVLNKAIEFGGSTIHSYHPKEGMSGNMQNELLAYGRKNEPCVRCLTPMRKIFVGGRGTCFCPRCQKRPTRPFVLGVTGPIHSGKSTVSEYLGGTRDYMIVDCDEIVSYLYEDKGVIEGLEAITGLKLLKGNELDRKVLGDYMSKGEKNVEAVNSYVHPLVKEEVEKAIASASGDDTIVLEVPLLVGSGLEDLCDAIVLVLAKESDRKERILEEGRDADKLLSINKKWPLTKAKLLATVILENDGSLVEFVKKIDSLEWLY